MFPLPWFFVFLSMIIIFLMVCFFCGMFYLEKKEFLMPKKVFVSSFFLSW